MLSCIHALMPNRRWNGKMQQMWHLLQQLSEGLHMQRLFEVPFALHRRARPEGGGGGSLEEGEGGGHSFNRRRMVRAAYLQPMKNSSWLVVCTVDIIHLGINCQ